MLKREVETRMALDNPLISLSRESHFFVIFAEVSAAWRRIYGRRNRSIGPRKSDVNDVKVVAVYTSRVTSGRVARLSVVTVVTRATSTLVSVSHIHHSAWHRYVCLTSCYIIR